MLYYSWCIILNSLFLEFMLYVQPKSPGSHSCSDSMTRKLKKKWPNNKIDKIHHYIWIYIQREREIETQPKSPGSHSCSDSMTMKFKKNRQIKKLIKSTIKFENLTRSPAISRWRVAQLLDTIAASKPKGIYPIWSCDQWPPHRQHALNLFLNLNRYIHILLNNNITHIHTHNIYIK